MSELTYISLFSSAGVGCYGFKMEDFQCIATNEIIERRLDIQRFNRKCKYETGYICGDITKEETKDQIRNEINRWKNHENSNGLDVLIATPPCQGMSVANHKKTDTEIVRNSLVVESVKLIRELKPKVFIFENVPAFMKTICTDLDMQDKPISEAIQVNLGAEYSYASRVINFKDYGACSSRSRTVVIGVRSDLADDISPYELFPDRKEERTLRDVIGGMRPLKTMGEISPDDIYHSFRAYPEHMRSWISDLREGESAFDNTDPLRRPHQIVDGVVVPNQRKNGDKYRRQFWDKTGPCVHTRNDQLASQNTVHPQDDRVFSIRELMMMMTIPSSFKWSAYDVEELNGMSIANKKAYLKKEEIKIRQSLGEAVPTEIFRSVANKIKQSFQRKTLTHRDIDRLLKSEAFSSHENILAYLRNNPDNLSVSMLARLAELANSRRTENAAFYTNKFMATEMMSKLPDTVKETVRILEPSVGVGAFLPLLMKRFDAKKIVIDAIDIDAQSIEIAKTLLTHLTIPKNVQINFICDDFLLHSFESAARYDYVVGNPPFGKVSGDHKRLKQYKQSAVNKETNNICSFFLDRCLELANVVSLVLPKAVLNIPEFSSTRDRLEKIAVSAILDFGEKGFKGVLVETIALVVQCNCKPSLTTVVSITENLSCIQQQKYIQSKDYPYWIIYRNAFFDKVAEQLSFDVFAVFRDRQITNDKLRRDGGIPVLKSRNIDDTGTQILNIKGYDSYIDREIAATLAVYKFLNREDVYLTPNMTYKPRVMRKPANVLVNGSLAILIPKAGIIPAEDQLAYFSSDEYRAFYKIARNYQTRSLNVDACSVYFFGLKKGE